MEKVILNADLSAACKQLFSPKGRLTSAIPGFTPRQSQEAMAMAICSAIKDKSMLIVEAGTGTGKTFAYLVPALIAGKKAIISTATKTLQDQLFEKDLPILKRALGLSIQVQNLKGRSNYICRHRTLQNANEGRFNTQKCLEDVTKVLEALPKLVSGERSELPFIKESSEAWPYVTSTADNCLGQSCQEFENCYLIKARRRALKADVVVINHHLFFADTQLKDEGFGELLPGVDCVVFDEAHQLPEIVMNFNSDRFSTRSCLDWMDDLIKAWPAIDLVNQPLLAFSRDLDKAIDKLMLTEPAEDNKCDFQVLYRRPNFREAIDTLMIWFSEVLAHLSALDFSELPSLKLGLSRLEDLHGLLLKSLSPAVSSIVWVEYFKQSLVIHHTPFQISHIFKDMMATHHAAYIFTSATLTMAESFDCFVETLGLGQAKTLLLPSPFDFKTQALLYLPRGMPDPKTHHYYDALLGRSLPLIKACAGRTFMLFTSHKALNQVAAMLRKMVDYPLLVQGEESKPILLARFRQLGNAILLGTATFWEGVDVKGEVLSCVIIDKLPFQSPFDPVVRGKMNHFRANGESGFDKFMLPDAVLALKQGVGRLIRDVSDKGVLMIADPRLVARDYGQVILSSLPAITKTRDEQTVLDFIARMVLPSTSHLKENEEPPLKPSHAKKKRSRALVELTGREK